MLLLIAGKVASMLVVTFFVYSFGAYFNSYAGRRQRPASAAIVGGLVALFTALAVYGIFS